MSATRLIQRKGGLIGVEHSGLIERRREIGCRRKPGLGGLEVLGPLQQGCLRASASDMSRTIAETASDRSRGVLDRGDAPRYRDRRPVLPLVDSLTRRDHLTSPDPFKDLAHRLSTFGGREPADGLPTISLAPYIRKVARHQRSSS